MNLHYDVDFHVGSLISEGGAGTVHECKPLEGSLLNDRAQGEPVVVKIMSESVVSMAEGERRAFFQEVSVAWRFKDHVNVAKVYGFCVKPACIIMRRYQYGDLNDFIIAEGILTDYYDYSKSAIVDVMKQVCAAVGYMHATGFAHCDIKPGNILMDLRNYKLQALLTDFGLARVLDAKAIKVEGYEPAETLGASITYASPEVLQRFIMRKHEDEPNSKIWKAGDIYALSMTLCKMLKRTNVW